MYTPVCYYTSLLHAFQGVSQLMSGYVIEFMLKIYMYSTDQEGKSCL